MLPCEIPKLSTDPLVRGFPGVWKLLLSQGSLLDGSLSLTLWSLFTFYVLFYLLLKRMGCLSGCLVSSARVQKLFCGICSAFKWSFDEFVGEKVVSPSYSSPFWTALYAVFLIMAILTGMRWYLIVFWFSFPWWLVMLSIFHVPVSRLYIFFGKVSI